MMKNGFEIGQRVTYRRPRVGYLGATVVAMTSKDIELEVDGAPVCDRGNIMRTKIAWKHIVGNPTSPVTV